MRKTMPPNSAQRRRNPRFQTGCKAVQTTRCQRSLYAMVERPPGSDTAWWRGNRIRAEERRKLILRGFSDVLPACRSSNMAVKLTRQGEAGCRDDESSSPRHSGSQAKIVRQRGRRRYRRWYQKRRPLRSGLHCRKSRREPSARYPSYSFV